MPGMDGRVLAGKLKAVRPGIRVLFMSGYAGETLAADGLPDPSITFIPKPLRPGLLAAKVRETLELA